MPRRSYYLTDEELDELTRFRWRPVLLGALTGFLLSGVIIALVLRLA